MHNPIRRGAAPTSDGELAMFESRTGLTLPAEYRTFLLADNGGVPRRNRFYHRSKKGNRRETFVRRFHPLGREGLIDFDVTDLESAWADRPAGLPPGVLPVGGAYFIGNEGAVCVACDGPDRGKVFFRPEVEPSKTTLYPVADDFATFLAEMEFEEGKERPWKTAIEDGDIPRLREWMERRRRRWAEDRSYSLDIERAAVEENSWPACVLLTELGFEADSLFEEALSYHRFDLALTLLRTGAVGRGAVAESLMSGAPYLWHVPPMLEALVAAGADVNFESETGDTPLHQAVEARSADGVRFLLAAGADPTAKNDDGRTPRGLARRLEETTLTALLQEGESAWKARPRPVEPDARPFDLCGVELSDSGPALSLEAIRAAEREFGLDFPPEYRWLLLQNNGAALRPDVLPIDPAEEDVDEESGPMPDPTVELFRLRKGQGRTMEGYEGHEYEGETVESARGWYHDGSSIPRGTLPIGSIDGYGCDGSGYLLLGCKGRLRGQLFAFDHGAQRLNLKLPDLFRALRQAADRPKDAGQQLADAVEARDLAAVRAALVAGARPGHATRDGRVPLSLAAEAGFDEALVAMTDAGADIDAVFTAALDAERFELALALLARQPAPSKRHLADQLGYSGTVMKRLDVVRAILARGLKPDRQFAGGQTYLHNAAATGGEEAIAFFAEQGVDVNAGNENGDTPLHYAAMGGDWRGIPALLARGAKVNVANSEGETALHLAVRGGNEESAKRLLDAGESLDARYDLKPAGVSPERAQREARRVAEMMQGGLGDLLGLDEDGPPPPDTSEPAGEKAAGLMGMMEQMLGGLASRMSGMQERLAELGRGSWGKGPSAADMAAKTDEGRALVARLRAYGKSKSP